ncbi:MAG: anti-sigma factor family protein [Candidatus Rokuibacteriota bacterium]
MPPPGGCSGPGNGSPPSEIECRQIAELLADYIDGTLPKHTTELIEWHIDGCAPCVAFLNTYRSTIRSARTLPDTPMPAELKKRLLSVLRGSGAGRRPPDRSPSA